MKPRTFGLLDIAFLAGIGLAGRGLWMLLSTPWLYLVGGCALMSGAWVLHATMGRK